MMGQLGPQPCLHLSLRPESGAGPPFLSARLAWANVIGGLERKTLQIMSLPTPARVPEPPGLAPPPHAASFSHQLP